MMQPEQSFPDYMLEIEETDHVAHNAKLREEIKMGSLKSGWCMTNHHHICPKEYVDPKTPGCSCPCHAAEPELDGWDLI